MGKEIIPFILIGIFALAILGGLTYYAFVIQPQVIVGETTYGSYTCPSDASICQITVILDCQEQTTEEQVIFRTNADISPGVTYTHSSQLRDVYRDKWIATDVDFDGTLNGWEYIRHGSGGFSFPRYIQYKYDDGTPIITKDGLFVGRDTSFNQYLRLTNGDIYVDFDLSTDPLIELSPSQVEPYTGNQQELLFGDLDTYSCSQSTSGAKTILVAYSDDEPGTEEQSFTINPGETINWDGEIEYSESITSCIAENGVRLEQGEAVCLDDFTLERCVSPPDTQKEFVEQEGEVCVDGEIREAYQVNIEINKLIFAEGETINIMFELTGTDDDKNIPVTASIRGTAISQSRLTGSSYFDAGEAEFNLIAPFRGFYTIEITMNHPDGLFEEEMDIQVTSGLTLNLFSDNPIQFDNELITLQLEAFKGGEKKRLTTYEVQAEFNGRPVFPDAVEPVGKDLRFYYDLKGDGTLRARARGADETGLQTDWTDYYEVNVKETGIEIVTDFKSGVCSGTLKNSFQTKDSGGNLVDTTNEVLINKPLSGVVDRVTVNRVGTGSYEFTYNFDENGLYIVEITSTHSTLGTYELNDGLGEGITILTGGSCLGTDREVGVNYLFWGIIGVFIIGIIGFIYLLFFRGRK